MHEQCVLESHFQPIFSLAHRRVVGHEALLRGRSDAGLLIPPKDLFGRCRSPQERMRLDQAALARHIASFARHHRPAEWLFLNIDMSLFSAAHGPSTAEMLGRICRDTGVAPSQIVLELLEDAIDDHQQVESQVLQLKAEGFLLALDDFGAGHSNFDRVFRLTPTVVKLDRGVVMRAAVDKAVRRITTQMVALLHECGSLVLMEGIEQWEEALVALDSDVDLVQGFYFGRPAPQMLPVRSGSSAIDSAWSHCDEQWHWTQDNYLALLAPYVRALGEVARALAQGIDPAQAYPGFLCLQDAEVCYLLDARGHQVGDNVFSHNSAGASEAQDAFAPLRDSTEACWSRRPYFRRAISSPGTPQVTRPYLSMQSLQTCVTISVGFELRGSLQVVCGDMIWSPDNVRPDFAFTDHHPDL